MAAVGVADALAGCNWPDRGPGGGMGGPRDGRGPASPAEGTATGSPPGGPAGTTVVAGPGGRFVFDPEERAVSVGDTVTWEFASAGHNVSCFPDHSDEVSLPEGAEPFGSMGPDGDPFETVPAGETYAHTFETAGTYRYVCVPHVRQGMIARVVVEE